MKLIQGTSFSKLLFAFLRRENENTSKIFLKIYYLEVVKGNFYVVKQILVSLFDECFLCMPEEQQNSMSHSNIEHELSGGLWAPQGCQALPRGLTDIWTLPADVSDTKSFVRTSCL